MYAILLGGYDKLYIFNDEDGTNKILPKIPKLLNSKDIHTSSTYYDQLNYTSNLWSLKYYFYPIKVESKSDHLYYFPVVLRGNERLKYNTYISAKGKK